MPTSTSSSAAVWSAAKVRQTFIDFFVEKHNHAFPSSPVVPHDDPTLLFTNAGMNQYKPIFLGQADPSTALGRLTLEAGGPGCAVNSQKCIRAGGKHNDLEDVGKDTYHHTFFEMLGNWSFGHYFKAESIAWAWQLMTEVFGIPADRLYATYFEGDAERGLEPDHEARDLWLRFLPAGQVLPGDYKDNFWEMGETGPCGPCSELHYDRIGGRDAAERVNADDPDVIELWNLVFIQFNRESATKLTPLPAKHVDTGMGLERIVGVLQNVRSNYDTDLFVPIFEAISRQSGGKYVYSGRLGADDTDKVDESFRVVADHVRTLTFAIADGAVPSNEGRGYVLRRVLRRAVRYGHQMLGLETGFLSELVPVVVKLMGEAFGELHEHEAKVKAIVLEEEESFGRQIEKGLKAINTTCDAIDALVSTASSGNKQIPTPSVSFTTSVTGVTNEEQALMLNRIFPGRLAFILHDTFGFPVDLTTRIAAERDISVDVAGFETCMEEQRERSRAGAKFGGDAGSLTLQPDHLSQLQSLGVKPSDDSAKFDGKPTAATVRAVFNGHDFDEAATPSANPSTRIGVIVNKTNFYAEMGGQVADTGTMTVTRETRTSAADAHQGGEFVVTDTQAFGQYVLHVGYVKHGEVRVGDTVEMKLDDERRGAVASNHTATHLLNWSLREVLDRGDGGGVDQKGSLVAPDRLRFDFSHNKPVGDDQLVRIEGEVRQRIEQDLVVHAGPTALEQAKQIHGLRAVFGETYPDPVRVVSVGVPVEDLLREPGASAWQGYSVEFCGGTHVASTKDIADFALTHEEGIAKGVRRITALTGKQAQSAQAHAAVLAEAMTSAAQLSDEPMRKRVAELTVELEQATIPVSRRVEMAKALGTLQEKVKQEQKAAAAERAKAAVEQAKTIAAEAKAAGRSVVVVSLELGSDRKALGQAVNTIASTCPDAAVMVFSPDADEGKVSIAAQVPEVLIGKGLKAGDWVREASAVCGGKGGGRPDSAQGGGTDVAKVDEAVEAARAFAAKHAD